MNLPELNAYFQQLNDWRAATARLEEMKAQILSSHKLDGMPAKQKQTDKIGDIVVTLDLAEKEVKRLEKGLKREGNAIRRFARTIPDNRTKLIIMLRFYSGLSWAEVAQYIGGNNSEKSVKMICYRFFEKK